MGVWNDWRSSAPWGAVQTCRHLQMPVDRATASSKRKRRTSECLNWEALKLPASLTASRSLR